MDFLAEQGTCEYLTFIAGAVTVPNLCFQMMADLLGEDTLGIGRIVQQRLVEKHGALVGGVGATEGGVAGYQLDLWQPAEVIVQGLQASASALSASMVPNAWLSSW